MYLLGTVLLVLWGMYVYPGDISNIPFAQLTLAKVFDCIFATSLYVGAVYLGFESLLKDRIWPWRWTWLYLASLMTRTIACCLLIGVFYFVALDRFKLDGWLLMAAIAVLGILLLFAMFTPDLDFQRPRAATTNAETP